MLLDKKLKLLNQDERLLLSATFVMPGIVIELMQLHKVMSIWHTLMKIKQTPH